MPTVEPVNARLGRVLVVEDDPGIATQHVRGLTRAGYETGSVTTGKAALDWPVPDVFLLDLGLPDMDGVEVCRRLRQACDAAIIIVTARGEETDRVLALSGALACAAVLSVAMHGLVFRLLRDAPPLAKVVASIGITLALQATVELSGDRLVRAAMVVVAKPPQDASSEAN